MLILEEEGPDDILFHREVTYFLNRKFPEKRTGRGGPIIWPPRSPDLSPLSFFLLEVHQGCCLHAIIGYHLTGTLCEHRRSRDNSVDIVSVYGLDYRGSIPGRGRGFFF
jgi:hypothetical protein